MRDDIINIDNSYTMIDSPIVSIHKFRVANSRGGTSINAWLLKIGICCYIQRGKRSNCAS